MHLVVGALLVHDGRVLLGHRTATKRWYPDVWDLIGGHIEAGESPEAALGRELDEELGVRLLDEPGEPLAHLVYPEGHDGGLDIRIWAVDAWHGEPINQAPEEHDDVRWFSRHEVQSLRLAHAALGPLIERLLGAH